MSVEKKVCARMLVNRQYAYIVTQTNKQTDFLGSYKRIDFTTPSRLRRIGNVCMVRTRSVHSFAHVCKRRCTATHPHVLTTQPERAGRVHQED